MSQFENQNPKPPHYDSYINKPKYSVTLPDIECEAYKNKRQGYIEALNWRAEVLNEKILNSINRQSGPDTKFWAITENALKAELIEIKFEIEELEK